MIRLYVKVPHYYLLLENFSHKSSRLFNNPSVTVPRAPIIVSIIITFMFHSFFNSLARSRYLSFFSVSLNYSQLADCFSLESE